MAHNETILVTGAGGFIGGWLAETIYLKGFPDVRAGIRNWSGAARLGRFPMKIVLCDVLNTEQIIQAIAGVTCVIHCAKGSKETIIEGTKNMLEIALRLGVKRFIHLSTAEIYGNQKGEIDETFPYQYTNSSYSNSKIDAEKLCWEYYEKGLPLTVVRPSIVYGPFSATWTIKYALNLQSGNWGIFKGYGEGICNLIYVSDLISGILLAIRNESAIGEAFNLVGPEIITWNQYFQRFNNALGLPELKVIDPVNAKFRTTMMEGLRGSAKFALAHFGGPLKGISQRFMQARKVMKSAEKSIKTTPSIFELGLFNRNALYLTTKAHHVLNFKPIFDLNRGMEMTAHWMKYLGLLDQFNL